MITADDITDDHQERMCELCERYILGCKHSTATFLCEGTRCEDAKDYLLEELNEQYLEKYKYLVIQ